MAGNVTVCGRECYSLWQGMLQFVAGNENRTKEKTKEITTMSVIYVIKNRVNLREL